MIVAAILSGGLTVSLLQRGVLLATSAAAASARELVPVDIAVWGLWLLLSPFALLAARWWPLRTRRLRDAACHVGMAALIAVAHTILLAGVQQLWRASLTIAPIVAATTTLLTWRLATDVLVYATVVGAAIASDATARANARERAMLAAEADAARAKLAALELQIQPHFLFNTLNTAAMLARAGHADEAADVVTRLGELFRDVVAEAPGATVSLARELAFIGRYVDIEKTRFGERLRLRVNVSSDALGVRIPRLLLQPLVENAIRHGLSRSPMSGTIELVARVERGELLVQIADDGLGCLPREELSPGLGIESVRSRLRALFGEQSALVLSPRLTGGTLVTLRIPAVA